MSGIYKLGEELFVEVGLLRNSRFHRGIVPGLAYANDKTIRTHDEMLREAIVPTSWFPAITLDNRIGVSHHHKVNMDIDNNIQLHRVR